MTILSEDIRKLVNLLHEVSGESDDSEDSSNDAPIEPDVEPEAKEITPDVPAKDDKVSPKDPTALLTQFHNPSNLTGSLNVNTLARALGIKNSRLFVQAFNKLKKLPPKKDLRLSLTRNEMAELSFAFYSLLASNRTVTSKVLTQLRQIHRRTDTHEGVETLKRGGFISEGNQTYRIDNIVETSGGTRLWVLNANGYGKWISADSIRQLDEDASSGATGAASIASVANPAGKVLSREPNLFGYSSAPKKHTKRSKRSS